MQWISARTNVKWFLPGFAQSWLIRTLFDIVHSNCDIRKGIIFDSFRLATFFFVFSQRNDFRMDYYALFRSAGREGIFIFWLCSHNPKHIFVTLTLTQWIFRFGLSFTFLALLQQYDNPRFNLHRPFSSYACLAFYHLFTFTGVCWHSDNVPFILARVRRLFGCLIISSFSSFSSQHVDT